MRERTVTDAGGRTWTCLAEADASANGAAQGQDVILACSTPSLADSIRVTVGWQWERMAPNGLARAINVVSPAPRD